MIKYNPTQDLAHDIHKFIKIYFKTHDSIHTIFIIADTLMLCQRQSCIEFQILKKVCKALVQLESFFQVDNNPIWCGEKCLLTMCIILTNCVKALFPDIKNMLYSDQHKHI